MIVIIACAAIDVQAHTGILAGAVIDQQSKSSIPSARIVIQGTKFGAITDTNGTFHVLNVPTGTYLVDASANGYKKQTQSVTITVDDTTDVVLGLAIDIFNLNSVVVTGDRAFSAAASTVLRAVDFELKPRQSAQDMLRLVPGLFIAQHAGGGKAEQIFLRGFDNDHGTDVNISVDGLPVNMVSHGHGQGYADLHWVIPEVVQGMEVNKGPYSAEYGDLATSGAVRFITANKLEHNVIGLEGGTFGTYRYLMMSQLPSSDGKTSAYVAGEFFHTDSYFDHPQGFNRYNLFGKLKANVGQSSSLEAWISGFGSAWNASGQVPERAIAGGTISRFGSIDPSEGGTTQRQNVNLTFASDNTNGSFLTQFYFTNYRFKLFSDFTFFRDDSVHGDQIEQDDNRTILGARSEYQFSGQVFAIPTTTLLGSAFRADEINTELWHTESRARLSNKVNVLVHQKNMSFYVQQEFRFSPIVRLQAGLRGEYFIFDLEDQLRDTSHADLSGVVQKTILNPKLNLVIAPAPGFELFINAGTGFHSNDARDVVAHPNDRTLPRITAGEIGTRLFLLERLHLSAAVWASELESELVYNGDDGGTQAAGATRRVGVDISGRLQLGSAFFMDVDVNAARGRFKGQADGHNYIPLAPVLTSTGGITYREEFGWEGSLRYRFMATRPANQDNTVQTRPYTVFDAVLGYRWERMKLGLTAENIFDVNWNEAQFDTESRLKGETVPVDELHFTPGTPLSMRLKVEYYY